MNFATITQAQFVSKSNAVGLWTKAEDVPVALRDVMLIACTKGDYYTPLTLGKEGLFAGLRQHQPRTAKLLMEAGPLILRACVMEGALRDDITRWIVNFGLEVHGQMVMIERGFYGSHPADPIDAQQLPLSRLLGALPGPIREAYYTTFCGMKLPDSPTVSVFGRFLPRYIGNWALWDQYLGCFRGYKKKYIPWLIEKLPETTPQKPSKYGFFDFRCMLESVPDDKGVVDFLWVKSYYEDGTIYHIRGKDVENMRILANPLEAIDLYCEHVLSRKEGTFDFMPFTEPMP